MLDVRQLEEFFPAAREAGFENIEVYAEISQSVAVRFKVRTDDIRFLIRRGISLRATREGVAHHVTTDSGEAAVLLAALKGEPLPRANLPTQPVPPDSVLAETVPAVLQILRGAFSSQSERLSFPDASVNLARKLFQIAREAGGISEGSEETADCYARWLIDGKKIAWERARGSIPRLLEDLAHPEGIAHALKQSLSTVARWPAPQGRVPVLWSARSVAKLQMLFLKAFEGDRVLDGFSFLTQVELPLALRFDLEDRPGVAQSAVDHEGSARKTTPFLKEGRPTALACNKRLADKLEVPPTGHARRESFETPATVGFWNPHLEANSVTDGLLSGMEQGVSVREIDVLHFNPASGEVVLRLSQAYLVHHGAEGEAMEPVTLQLPLLLLLESLNDFESTSHTTGLVVDKQNQRFYVELTTPAALSRPLPLPGSVPLNHYW